MTEPCWLIWSGPYWGLSGVEHVCDLAEAHEGPHHCRCGEQMES